MTAYYNEHDRFAAAWLRELISAGHIADGIVDERDIRDVMPSDIADFTQCHFFAGIGVWSHSLRAAGWSDDRPIWTGSCPCQPFSAAGKGGGFDDERHLWPAFHWLIEQRRPRVVVGEQVSSKDGLAWIDLVSTDMENSGYAFGSLDLCAAGVGAPHIRQRSYWLADQQSQRVVGQSEPSARPQKPNRGYGFSSRLADCGQPGREGRTSEALSRAGRRFERDGAGRRGERLAGGLGDAARSARERDAGQFPRAETPIIRVDGDLPVGSEYAGAGMGERSGPVNGAWRNADWLGCTDGRWRPVESGTFPLVNGLAGRVGRLRGFGNAIVAPLATAFVETVMECLI